MHGIMYVMRGEGRIEMVVFLETKGGGFFYGRVSSSFPSSMQSSSKKEARG